MEIGMEQLRNLNNDLILYIFFFGANYQQGNDNVKPTHAI